MKKYYQKGLYKVCCFLSMMVLMLGVQVTAVAQTQVNSAANGKVVAAKNITALDGRQVQLSVSGQMPSKAKVQATPVQRTSPNGKQVFGAYDITIQNGNAEWQPQAGQPVMVSISDPNFTDGQMMDVYHEGANGNEFVATVAAQNGKITFPARSFSVYIVTEVGEGARLKVNFHQADNNVVSIYVKAADATDEETYKTVLYDPGVGTLPTGVQFRGWTTNPDYTVAQVDDGMTIGQVRTMVESLLADVSDGDSLVLYPMLFKLYRLTYFDEEGAVLKSQEVLFLVNSDQNYHACTVNEAYTPSSSEQNFLGWRVTEGDNNIQGYTQGTLYQNETTIYIKGNVKLRAHVPYGRWLVFNENGKGASFTAAQFVENGQNTVEPIEPTRVGYQFGGWYTDAACTDGNEFTFNSTITDHVTVYAKWTLNPTAGYTVIIWKQNVSGTSYDFGASITNLTGTPNTVISSVSQVGTGNGSYAQVSGTSYQYSGFHLDHFDQNVTISPEGNSVLNVYYNRNQHTLTFQIQQGYTWTTIKTITALYEQSIGANFPIVGDNGTVYNNGERWSPQTNSLGYNQVMVYLDIMPAGDVTFRLNTADRPLKTMNYYVEALPDETGTTITAPNTLYNYNNTSITAPSGKRYVLYNSISARYNGVTVEDFIELLGYERLGANSARSNQSGTSYWIWSTTQNGTVNFFYTRKVYSINFMDGVYKTGDGAPINDEPNHGQWTHVDNIAYGADISSYNNDGDDYYVPVKDGYAFEGWYIDDACTQPYTFDKMIEGGITVYAKWRQIQYRVFLHPNAVDPETGANDQSFDWPEGQKFNFRVDFGEKIATPTANRDDYKFVGWYTDSTFNHVFNGDMIVLNDQTVTTPYDKTVDMTDDVDAWGNIIPQGAYNSDITGNDGGDRFWITRKLDLYARWRSILEGAKGINIRYVYIDPEEHTNIVLVQTEEDIFNDDVTAFSIPAPAPDAVLPEGGRLPSAQDSVFFKWVIQHWSAEDGDFIDSDVSVYPGSPFSVSKNDALKEDNPGYATDSTQDQYIYTIQVRAEYIPVEKYSSTFIVWYYNYENANPDTVRQDGKLNVSDPHANLDINKAVSIPVPTRPGYLFKGWFKAKIEDVDDVESTYTIPNNTPNFLFYNNEDEKFYANYNANTGTYSNPADSVAADEDNPYDYLYAVWEANGYTVHFDNNGADGEETMDDQMFDFENDQALMTNAFTYTDHCFLGWATTDDATEVAYEDGYTVDHTAPLGEAGETVNLYAVWTEVPTVTVEDVTVCQGGTTTMTAVLSNTQLTGVTYQWYTVEGETETAIEGATAATYTPTASGSYKVVATNNGCTANATATLTINPLPTVTLTVPTDAQVLCPNKDTYPVSAEATGGTAPYTYAWTGATPTTENGPAANVLQNENNCTEGGYPYTVSVVATDDNGCASAADEDNFTVQMAAGGITIPEVENTFNVDCASEVVAPTEDLPKVYDACGNELTPSAPVMNPTTVPACGGTVTYTYTYTDCAGTSANLVYTYNISEPANPTLTLQTEPVTATAAGECKYKIPAVQYTAAAACDGELTVTQLPTAGTMIEQTDVDQEVEIAVTAVDGCNKSTTVTTTVIIPAKPTVSITPESPSTCYGSSVTLTASEGFASYSWSNNATGAEITVANLTEATTITVTATDANGCTATTSTEVTVDEIGTANITGADEVCMNGDVELTAPEGVSYIWNTGATTQSITVQKMTQTATFSVTVTDAGGCVSQGEITVTVNPLPTVTLTVPTTDQELCPNQGTYEVSATAANGTTPYSFAWTGATPVATTGTATTTSVANVQQQGASDCAPNGTEYTVSVVVTDNKGCASATAEESFTVIMATGGITMTEVPTQSIVTCAQEIVEPTLPTVTDACGNTLEPIDLDISPEIPSVCDGEQTYTYTYEDCVGNSVEWVYTFIFQAPVLTFDGEIIDEEGIDACYSAALADEYLLDDAAVMAMFSSDCEFDEITVSHVDATKEDNNDCDWEIQRIFTIRNACTTVYKTQVLTGGDQTAPTFTAPAAYTTTFNPDGTYNIDPEDAGEVEDATDNCTTITESNIDYVDETEENEDGSLTITRTWTVTDNCELSTSDDQIITVNPISDPVVVYITGDQVTETYNGTWFVASGYTVDNVTINGETTTAYTENDFEFNSNAHAERKDAGKTDMGISSDDFVNTNPIFSNVTFVVEDGFVQVNKKPITIFANVSKQYDGTPLQITYEDVTVTPDLADGDELTDGILYTDGYDAGEYRCTANQFEYMMALNAIQEDFTIENSEHQKVNANYSPTFDVTLTITSVDCQGVTYQDYYYPAVQIGTQCWLAENLRNTVYGPEETTAIENYAAYKNDEANMEKFGYLYTWYSAVGVEENNNADVPETLEGTSLVQGICPEGWVVPSQTDFDILYQFTANEARRLRDMNPMYWIPGEQGVEPNYHFNSRAGGFYNSTSGQFERILLEDYYWTSTSDPNTTEVTSPMNAYYCNSINFQTSKKSDMRSVRCISQQTAYGAPTETEEGEGDGE